MKRSYLTAIAVTLLIAGWMLLGQFNDKASDKAESTAADVSTSAKPMLVAVLPHQAQTITLYTIAQGHTEPNRAVTVRAETKGRISEVVAIEGEAITTSSVLLRLEMGDRQARLKKTQALLQERKRGYARAMQLDTQGFQSQRLTDEQLSALEAVRAELAEIEIEIAHTQIRAPFNGILEHRHVDLGDYVAINTEIATLVDNHPLVVSVQIPQQQIDNITLASTAEVAFATGQTRTGKVRYIAPRAESATRTFRVEIEMSNPDGEIRSGISAETRLPTGQALAHFISPALLSLNSAGLIGVKTVTGANTVEFHTVRILRAEADGVWVSGLPELSRIITVGQGFVREGDTVQVALQPTVSAAHISPQTLNLSHAPSRSKPVPAT